MKITRERLKDIIKEELENSQNEGIFGKLKAKMGFGSKKFEPLTDKFEAENTKLYRSHFDMETGAEVAAVVQAMAANFDQYLDAMHRIDLSKDQQMSLRRVMRLYKDELSRISDRAEDMGARDAKGAVEKAERRAREQEEEQAEYVRQQRRSRNAEKARDVSNSGETRSSRKSGFDKWQSGEGDNYNYMTRMEEGKITKRDLKVLIAEELTAVEKGKKAELEKELTGIAGSRGISKTMNKGAKDKIEKELDDLKHK
tara:strand:- start:33 stop:800 length:768 start_codon:yes stop_codon:yes gene_type:complete